MIANRASSRVAGDRASSLRSATSAIAVLSWVRRLSRSPVEEEAQEPGPRSPDDDMCRPVSALRNGGLNSRLGQQLSSPCGPEVRPGRPQGAERAQLTARASFAITRIK